MKKGFFAFIFISAAFVSFNKFSAKKANTEAINIDETHGSSQARESTYASLQAKSTTETSTEKNDSNNKNEVPNDAFDIFAWNYKSPKFAKPKVYETVIYKPQFASNCANKKNIEYFNDVNQHVKKKTGFDATSQFPKSGNFRLFTQNWKLNGKFHSLTANWQITDPPVYDMVYQVSTSERGDNPNYPDIPGYKAESEVDADKVLSVMEEMLANAKSKGAEEGARIIHISEVASDQKTVHAATFVNQIPVDYSNGKVFCTFSSRKENVNCTCEAPEDGHGH